VLHNGKLKTTQQQSRILFISSLKQSHKTLIPLHAQISESKHALNPINEYHKIKIRKKGKRKNKTLTGSESSLIEGPIAPSLDRS